MLTALSAGEHRLEDFGFEVLEPLRQVVQSDEEFPEFGIPAAEREEEQAKGEMERCQMYEQDPGIQEGKLVLGSPDKAEANGITLTFNIPLRELRAACKFFGRLQLQRIGSCRGSCQCKERNVMRSAKTSHCTS